MSSRAEAAAAKSAIPALAAALVGIGAAMSGCAPGERGLFLTLAGEAPGTRTPFVEIAGAPPLGRPPPQAPDTPAGRFHPAAGSGAGSDTGSDTRSGAETAAASGRDAVVADAHRRVRRALADREQEFALRTRSLDLFAADYLAAAGALALQAGDPLPADDAGHRARMKAARDVLDAVGGDLVKLNALILRIERDRIAARRVAAAARERGGALAGTAGATAAAANAMLMAVRGYAGDWLVYAGGQRVTLDRLAAQIAAAAGAANIGTAPVRRTLAE